MKTLLILRHAKSSWNNANLSDHDRPLNDRGKRDAPQVGRLIEEREIVPEAILCSTAKRARKTAAKVAAECGFEGEVEQLGDLYLAPPSTYIDVLRTQPDELSRVMVVGHNPGLEMLVAALTGRHEHFPTAALAQIELDIASWQQLDEQTTGELVALWRPREL